MVIAEANDVIVEVNRFIANANMLTGDVNMLTGHAKHLTGRAKHLTNDVKHLTSVNLLIMYWLCFVNKPQSMFLSLNSHVILIRDSFAPCYLCGRISLFA